MERSFAAFLPFKLTPGMSLSVLIPDIPRDKKTPPQEKGCTRFLYYGSLTIPAFARPPRVQGQYRQVGLPGLQEESGFGVSPLTCAPSSPTPSTRTTPPAKPCPILKSS